MAENTGILVVAEHRDGALAKVTLESIGKGRALPQRRARRSPYW